LIKSIFIFLLLIVSTNSWSDTEKLSDQSLDDSLDQSIDRSIDQEKEAAKIELEQLKGKIKLLQSNLASKQKQQSSVVKKLRSSEKKIATASKILRNTNSQLKRKEKQLNQLKRKQKGLQKNKNQQKKLLAEQLRSAYMNGKQEYLQLLLNQQDPEKLGRMLVYYDYLNKARSKQLNELQKILEDLKTVDLAIQKEIQDLEVLQKSKKEETKQLLSLKKKREKLVASLAKEINSASDQLTELEINAQQLQQLIDSVQETIEDMDFSQPLEGIKNLRGKLKWPARGKQLIKFASTNRGQRSTGVLIGGKEGSEIEAIHHGRVVYADWLRGFGLLLILDHGKGYMSLYGYNQALYKDVGDWVEAGESISTLGQSGGQKQPALYFELRHQGKAINPNKWLKN